MNVTTSNNLSSTELPQPIDPKELPLMSESSGEEVQPNVPAQSNLGNDHSSSKNPASNPISLDENFPNATGLRSKHKQPSALERNLSELFGVAPKKPSKGPESLGKGIQPPKVVRMNNSLKPKKKVFGLRPTNLVRPVKIEEGNPQDKAVVELLEIIQRDNSMFKPEVPLDFAFQTLSQALAMNKKNKKAYPIPKPVKKQQTYSLSNNFTMKPLQGQKNGESAKDPSFTQLDTKDLLFDVNDNCSMSASLSLSSDEEKTPVSKKPAKAEVKEIKRYTKDGREKKKPGPKKKEPLPNEEQQKKTKKPSELELINAARILMGLPLIRRGRGRPRKNKTDAEGMVANKHPVAPTPVVDSSLIPPLNPTLMPSVNPALMAHMNPALISQMNMLLLNNLFAKPEKSLAPEFDFKVKVQEESTH